VTWTVEEMTKDGHWIRCALAHSWETNKDAHEQRDALAKRFPKRIFAVVNQSSQIDGEVK